MRVKVFKAKKGDLPFVFKCAPESPFQINAVRSETLCILRKNKYVLMAVYTNIVFV